MTDDEIKQLGKLKEDKDKVKRESCEAKCIERIRDEEDRWSDKNEEHSNWFNRLFSKRPQLQIDFKSLDVLVRDNNTHFELSPADFNNPVVVERIRMIQSKVFKIVADELELLYKEMEQSLLDYHGENIYPYIRAKLKMIESKPVVEEDPVCEESPAEDKIKMKSKK